MKSTTISPASDALRFRGAVLLVFLLVAAQSVIAQSSVSRPNQLADQGGSAARASVRASTAINDGAEMPAPVTATALDRIIDRKTYRLAPGDKLLVSLWGSISRSHPLIVTPEGMILIPSVGPVTVGNLTLDDAQKKVIEVSRGVYRGASVTLNLVELRKFRVHVTGMVRNPGTYVSSPAERVSDVIEKAGGLAGNASYRMIRVTGPVSRSVSADLGMFVAAGDLAKNPVLEMGDVVYVPVRRDSVAIWGGVNIPGHVEYRDGDTIEDLLRLSGGLREDVSASSIVEWTSFPRDTGRYTTRSVSLSKARTAPLNTSLRPGDRLVVLASSAWRPRYAVTVAGEVRYPGTFPVVEGQTRLSEIIRRAGGLKPVASPNASYVLRRSLRDLPDAEYERLLQTSATDLTSQEKAYWRMRGRQRRGSIPIDFAKALANPGSAADMVLMDRDSVVVDRRRETIEIAGQVERPGLIAWKKGGTFGYYLRQAGGYSWNARTGDVRIIKAGTGVWLDVDDDTVLDPGDTIFVPDKPYKDWWTVFKDVLLVASQIATIILVISTTTK
jgi:polysaccharide biosynthesis/export protein